MRHVYLHYIIAFHNNTLHSNNIAQHHLYTNDPCRRIGRQYILQTTDCPDLSVSIQSQIHTELLSYSRGILPLLQDQVSQVGQCNTVSRFSEIIFFCLFFIQKTDNLNHNTQGSTLCECHPICDPV